MTTIDVFQEIGKALTPVGIAFATGWTFIKALKEIYKDKVLHRQHDVEAREFTKEALAREADHEKLLAENLALKKVIKEIVDDVSSFKKSIYADNTESNKQNRSEVEKIGAKVDKCWEMMTAHALDMIKILK